MTDTNIWHIIAQCPRWATLCEEFHVLFFLLTQDRQVGICLKHLPDSPTDREAIYWSDTVPWQRVISAKGVISPRSVPDTLQREKQKGISILRRQ